MGVQSSICIAVSCGPLVEEVALEPFMYIVIVSFNTMKNKQRIKQQVKEQRSPATKDWRWIIGVFMVLSATVVMLRMSERFAVPDNPSAFPLVSAANEHENAGQERLVGRWLRSDGGYVIEIRSAASDGKIEAFYFNPNPIHVGHAEWQQKNNTIIVVVELSDVNYPGSTYTLEFLEGEGRMKGTYYQAMEKVNFDVEFAREK